MFNIASSYNFSRVVLTVGGYPIGGYGDDGGVSIDYAGDDATMTQGADGEVVINQLPSQPATVTVTLKEVSKSNAILAGLRDIQRALPVGYVLPFLLLDPSTGESLACAQCAFANRPNVSKTKEAGEREWHLLIPHPVYVGATL
uniref:Uncharacterized protein n=1 Tax=viral metagenome TaxID=1070528 RepID=A0A6M3KSW2_9ZZZZ